MAKSRRSSSKKVVSQREKSRKSAGRRKSSSRRNSSSDSSRSGSDRSRSNRSYSSSRRSSRSSPSSRSEKSNSTSPSRSDRSSSPSSLRSSSHSARSSDRSSSRNSRRSDQSASSTDRSGKTKRKTRKPARGVDRSYVSRSSGKGKAGSPGKPRLVRRSIRIAKKKDADSKKPKKKVVVPYKRNRSRRLTPEETIELLARESAAVEAARGSPAPGLNQSVTNQSGAPLEGISRIRHHVTAQSSPAPSVVRGSPARNLNEAVANLPGNSSIVNNNQIHVTTIPSQSPNSQSGRTSTPLPRNTARGLYRASIVNRAPNVETAREIGRTSTPTITNTANTPTTPAVQAAPVTPKNEVKKDGPAKNEGPSKPESSGKNEGPAKIDRTPERHGPSKIDGPAKNECPSKPENSGKNEGPPKIDRTPGPSKIDGPAKNEGPSKPESSGKNEGPAKIDRTPERPSPSKIDGPAKNEGPSKPESSGKNEGPAKIDSTPERPGPSKITGPSKIEGPAKIDRTPERPGPSKINGPSKIEGPPKIDRTPERPGPSKIDGFAGSVKTECSGNIEVPLKKEAISTPIKAKLIGALTVPSDVRCNLQLPLTIKSAQKVRVSPQNEEIIIETRTILMSKDASEADSIALYLVRPSVDHASFETEKGRNEEISENRVLIGKNTVLIERHTAIKKSEFEENLSAQTKKEHNRMGTCEVDGLTGPLSIHCASGTVINGYIYNKKELITIFLTEQPVSLKREELNGILSRKLIREEVPEVEKNTIKSDEKMMTNGKYILTLERDVRIFADNEMWTNENEVVTTEERKFEVGKIANGDVTIIERNHQVSKAVLDKHPSFHNRSALPSVTGPYAPRTDRTAQTTMPLQKTPETPKSSKDKDVSIRNRAKARENLFSSDSIANTPVKRFPPKSPDVTLPATPYWMKPMMPLQKTPESPESYKGEKEASSSRSPDRKKSKIVTPVYISSIANTPTKRLSFPSKSPGATLTPIRMKPLQNTAKIRATTPTNTLNVRNAATPTSVAGSQSPSMLSRSMNPITPKRTVTLKKSESPLRKKNDTESRRDHKKSVDTSVVGVEHFERTINISKTGTVNTEAACKLTVPMEVVAKINGDTYKLKINLEIVNDSKDIRFVAKKFVVDGKTLWNSEEANAASNSKQN